MVHRYQGKVAFTFQIIDENFTISSHLENLQQTRETKRIYKYIKGVHFEMGKFLKSGAKFHIEQSDPTQFIDFIS